MTHSDWIEILVIAGIVAGRLWSRFEHRQTTTVVADIQAKVNGRLDEALSYIKHLESELAAHRKATQAANNKESEG